MIKVTSAALFFLAAGILTSVTILSAYQVLFTIAAAYFTFLAFKDKNINLPKSAYWLLAFTVVALTATILNVELIPKPSKNFGRLKYFLYGVTSIFVFRYWLNQASLKTKKIIIQTFLVSILVAGIYAISRYILGAFVYHNDNRARPLTETMRYGYGSSMFLLSLLSAYLHKEKFKDYFNSKLLLSALVIGFTGMFLTFTRGALLGFLCGLPFVLYFYRPKLAIVGGIASSLILLILGSFYLFGSSTNDRFRILSTKGNGSDQIRSSQWQAAVIAIKEKPLLGWGLSNFHSQLKRIKNSYDLPAKDYDDAHAHNLFLEIGAGTGLIGLFLFLGWVITWAFECFRSGGLVAALTVPFGVAFVVASQFEVTLDANNASMIMAVYGLSGVASLRLIKSSHPN